jgi:hypothetical protein
MIEIRALFQPELHYIATRAIGKETDPLTRGLLALTITALPNRSPMPVPQEL